MSRRRPLTGRAVRAVDGVPIPYATARVAELNGDPVTQSGVDADGRFRIDIRPGSYAVYVEAFGFVSQAFGARSRCPRTARRSTWATSARALFPSCRAATVLRVTDAV
ncbi:MAG: carboxypeptidase-like regulatory domain-containing protein [Anaerolineae bacterium]